MASTIEEWLNAGEYIVSRGNHQLLFVERGIRTFEPWTRNTFDINAVAMMKQLTHFPIIADPSHGIGKSEYVTSVAKASVVARSSWGNRRGSSRTEKRHCQTVVNH